MLGAIVMMTSTPFGRINGSLPNSANINSPAVWSLLNDGTYSASGAGTGDWVVPANEAQAALWEVMVSVTSGAVSSGTTDSWLSLDQTRTWTVNAVGSATITVQFRDAASQTVRSTQAGITISVASA